jgi:hypothetical protein
VLTASPGTAQTPGDLGHRHRTRKGSSISTWLRFTNEQQPKEALPIFPACMTLCLVHVDKSADVGFVWQAPEH